MADRGDARVIVLTELVGEEVLERDGTRIGRLADVSVRARDATACALRLRDGREILWDDVESVGPPVRVRIDARPTTRRRDVEGELMLAAHVLDRQIFDARGRRFRRVGDLELESTDGRLRVRGAQVGLDTLVRRLGLGRLARGLTVDVVEWGDLLVTAEPGREIQLRSGHPEVHHHAAAELAGRRAARRRHLSPLRRRRRAPA
jgi:sporulation protein YlmC with PRC-barrel domain